MKIVGQTVGQTFSCASTSSHSMFVCFCFCLARGIIFLVSHSSVSLFVKAPHWQRYNCWLVSQYVCGMWTSFAVLLGSDRVTTHTKKGCSKMSSWHTGGTATGWAESSACLSNQYQCPGGRWRHWWAASRLQTLPPPMSLGGRFCVSVPAVPLPGSAYGARVPRSCGAWRIYAGMRCKELRAGGHRRWRVCYKHRPAAHAPGPSRTPHKWWSLHLWTPHGKCGPQLEPPSHRRWSRCQRVGKHKPRLRCVSSEGARWRSI